MYTVKLAMSYEEWKANGGVSDDVPKEIVSGTDAPKSLMPGSPLSEVDVKKEETTVTEIAVVEAPSVIDYTHIVSAGCGFIIGVLITVLFFNTKIKQIKKECETKVDESRKSLDRIVQMMSQK